MLSRSCAPVSALPGFGFRSCQSLLMAAALLLVFSAQVSASALPTDAPAKDAMGPPCQRMVGFDDATDIYAVRNFEYRIAQMLNDSNFDGLDCVADATRSGKERFSGGAWKIHRIYSGLAEPKPGRHSTEEQWSAHLARLEHWVRMKPDSITARVALAKSYVGYAWEARGTGYAGSVSDAGWNLFAQRLEQAKTILNDASVLNTKCPEWYLVMQQVALGEGVDPVKARQLLQTAVKFEPGYYYYYRMHANFLLPKWYGEEGDSSKFAAETANTIGGKQGDVLYFWIATQVACACGEPEFNRFSWQRIQRGFEEVKKQYGQSMTNLNSLALMAVKQRDAIAADRAFQRIGNNWDEETWRKEAYFRESKEWAQKAPPQVSTDK
jgi:hypothetical protein